MSFHTIETEQFDHFGEFLIPDDNERRAVERIINSAAVLTSPNIPARLNAADALAKRDDSFVDRK